MERSDSATKDRWIGLVARPCRIRSTRSQDHRKRAVSRGRRVPRPCQELGVPKQTAQQRLLTMWRERAASTKPGSRRAIDRDIPIRMASVRTSAHQLRVCLSMVEWLRAPNASPPWEAITRALHSSAGEASHVACDALASISELRPRLWTRVLRTLDESPPATRRVMLQATWPRARHHMLLVHAASDTDAQVRDEAISRACLCSDPRLFPEVAAAARIAHRSPVNRASLSRYEALFHQGYFAKPGRRVWEFEVVLDDDRDSRAVTYEQVPSRVVRRFGEAEVAACVRRVCDSTEPLWPVDWNTADVPRLGRASSKSAR